jgi:membrane complex biogenesis BtpA family protein
MSVPHASRARPFLVGVVHMPPLPGAPRAAASRRGEGAFVARAVADARAYAAAGFSAVTVENYGDSPFFKDHVPPETVASLSAACHAVRSALPAELQVGVNVLRNDTRAAVAVAAACGLDFVRVNVLSGAMVTDQGVIEGRGADVLRDRARLAPHLRIFADVRVKHSAPLAPRPLDEEVKDLVTRGGADAVIVTGARTGATADVERLREVRAAAGRTPVFVGSGTNAANIAAMLALADGAIVGTSVKRGGVTANPVDPARARAFVRAARG